MEIGSLSDLISAFGNVVMAGSAWYAAWNAKGWFKSKIKENALTKVNQFLTNCDVYSLEMRNLYLRIHELNNTQPEYQPQNFGEQIRNQRNKIDEMQIKHLSLKNEFKSLTNWEVKPVDGSVFIEYFKSNSHALITLGEAISFDINNVSERLQYNLNYGRALAEASKDLRNKHDSLKISIKELFIFP